MDLAPNQNGSHQWLDRSAGAGSSGVARNVSSELQATETGRELENQFDSGCGQLWFWCLIVDGLRQ